MHRCWLKEIACETTPFMNVGEDIFVDANFITNLLHSQLAVHAIISRLSHLHQPHSHKPHSHKHLQTTTQSATIGFNKVAIR